MEWYLPITILPGLGMLILSTSTQMMGLSAEIGSLLSNKCREFEHIIAERKIKQLALLTRSSVLLYIAAGCYVLSGILGAILPSGEFSIQNIILYIGTICIFLALVLLIIYASKAVAIRQLQFKHNHTL